MPTGMIFGVRVRLGGSFALVVLLLAAAGRFGEAFTMFGIVLLHELAHALVAWRRGLTVDQIELTPIGGVARIDALFEADPASEFAVAIAGPMCNFALAFVGWIALGYNLLSTAWLSFFIYANLSLAVFNLVPALPLDGGRLYRSRLIRRVGYREATLRAVRISRRLSLVLFGIGVVGTIAAVVSVTLVFLALFVHMAARREEANAPYVLIRCLALKRDELSRHGPLRALHMVVPPTATLKEVGEQLIPHRYHLVWALEPRGKVLGMVTETQLLDAFFARGMYTTVGELLQEPEHPARAQGGSVD